MKISNKQITTNYRILWGKYFFGVDTKFSLIISWSVGVEVSVGVGVRDNIRKMINGGGAG